MCVSLLPPSQEKTDIQRQLNAARTEQQRSLLERRMEEEERRIQEYKQYIEYCQGRVKSREESLQQLEKEEEEGVWCVVHVLLHAYLEIETDFVDSYAH